jgi:tetratricopeptide (TPR) repeat protein
VKRTNEAEKDTKTIPEGGFEAEKQGIPSFHIRDFSAETPVTILAGDRDVAEGMFLYLLRQALTSVHLRKFIVVVLLLGCSSVTFGQTQAMEKALVMKDYAEVIRIAESYLNKKTGDKEEVLYLLAEAYIGTSNLPKARETLRSLYKQFPHSNYAKKATLRIADTYYLESNYNQAKNIYDYFLQEYKDDEYLSSVYLKLAYCEEKLGNWQMKRYYMDSIARRFPKSIEAGKLEELEQRGFHFVVQVGAFGDKNNSQDLVHKLKEDGFSAYVLGEKEDGKLFYKVRIGKFTKRASAEYQLEALIKKGYPARIFP